VQPVVLEARAYHDVPALPRQRAGRQAQGRGSARRKQQPVLQRVIDSEELGYGSGKNLTKNFKNAERPTSYQSNFLELV